MPIYSYHCPKHGTVDVIVPSYKDQKEKINCPIARSPKSNATVCGRVIELQPSLCAMKPDKYWHTGRYVESLDQTFKSEKDYQTFLKRTGRQAAEPGDSLQATRGIAAKEERLSKEREHLISQTIAGFDDSTCKAAADYAAKG